MCRRPHRAPRRVRGGGKSSPLAGYPPNIRQYDTRNAMRVNMAQVKIHRNERAAAHRRGWVPRSMR